MSEYEPSKKNNSITTGRCLDKKYISDVKEKFPIFDMRDIRVPFAIKITDDDYIYFKNNIDPPIKLQSQILGKNVLLLPMNTNVNIYLEHITEDEPLLHFDVTDKVAFRSVSLETLTKDRVFAGDFGRIDKIEIERDEENNLWNPIYYVRMDIDRKNIGAYPPLVAAQQQQLRAPYLHEKFH